MFLGLTLPFQAHAAHLYPYRRHSQKISDAPAWMQVCAVRRTLKRPLRSRPIRSFRDASLRIRKTASLHVPDLTGSTGQSAEQISHG